MRQYFLIMLVLTFVWTMVGCQTQEVTDIASALGIGLDLNEEKISLSVQLAKPINPQQSQENPSLIALATGATASEAGRNLSLRLPRKTLWSHANLLLLGENLAKQDLGLVMDMLVRNIDIRKSSLMYITKGYTPQEIMQAETPLVQYSALGLQDLMQTQEQQLGIFVPLNLGEFIQRLSTPGTDPLVPQVTLEKQGDKMVPTLKGAAAFRGRKMVGSLNEDEVRGYRFLLPGSKKGGILIVPSPVNPERTITLEITRFQSKSQAIVSGDSIRMQVEIDVEGNFYDHNSPGQVLTPEHLKTIEKLANKEIMRQCNASIARAQDLKSDIFGWGRQVEISSPQTFKKLVPDWDEIFSEIKAEIKVNYSLRRTYLADRNFTFR
ncbi:MAG: Ger(x)C family spore germination protein [Syntrophomonadaceae bacterium]|jgi:spore germination protein KC